MILSNCDVCGKKKSLFIKNKEFSNDQFKMNKIINKCLLTRDKFMPKLHLKQQGFNYSFCGSFTNYCKRIQKFRETGNLKHLYKNELDKACFAHDETYSYSNNLRKISISDQILKDRAYKIAKDRDYNGYQKALGNVVYKFLEKKTGLGISVSEQLAEELHKPVTKKCKKRKV